MKAIWIRFALLGLTLSTACLQSLNAQDASVVVNEGVSATSLEKAALKDILVGKTAYWQGGQAVTIIVLRDKTDAALEAFSGMSPSQFRTHWQRLTFSGRGKQPKEVDSVEKLAAAVADTKGALAIAPAGTEVKGARKLEIK